MSQLGVQLLDQQSELTFLKNVGSKLDVSVAVMGVNTTFEGTGDLFVLSGLAAIIVTSIAAIYQRNIKRLLAFSSVAQIGYIMLGASMVSVLGLSAGLLHVFNHALS